MHGKIIVVYHRQPYQEYMRDGKISFKPHDKPNGIIPLLKSFFSSVDTGVWVASSLFANSHQVPLREEIELIEMGKSIVLRRIPMSDDEMHSFYHKSSKDGFWPILHTFPEKFNYESVEWEVFESINKRFAEAVCDEITSEADIVWVHDYNLWLAPYFIRKLRPANRIAFFFHTPFPGADAFNILPWRRQIVESLLSCDLLSFDIPRYVENFVSVARSNVSVQVTRIEQVSPQFTARGSALSEPLISKELLYDNRSVLLDAFPEGTNFELIASLLQEERMRRKIHYCRDQTRGKKVIFAASRTDYIKGTVELLKCFDRLLVRNPAMVSEIVLSLVAVKPADGMSAYNEIQAEIENLVEQINTKYGNGSDLPVLYSTRALSFEEMISWFAVCNVMFVPSLRDGMNIISKEFVATKKLTGNGILVLSEFAGASVELHDAILTNPYSADSMDEAIDQALAMSSAEQNVRLKNMFKKIMMSDIKIWSRQLTLLRAFAVRPVEETLPIANV